MQYRILGVTQAEDDRGAAVPVGGPRLRALLTALALRPGRVTAPGALIDEVWGEDPPQDAPAALQALVGRLRRTLGRDAIRSETGGYRLAVAEDGVDLFAFEGLVRRGTAALGRGDASAAARCLDEALALWRGPALADLPDRTAAARVDTLRLEAVRCRADARLRLGRAAEVVPELTELTVVHPYDESLHALLIRALRDTGRGADALAAYERARRALADGLGTDPGPGLRALHAGLLAPAPLSSAPPAPSGPVPAPHAAPTTHPSSATEPPHPAHPVPLTPAVPLTPVVPVVPAAPAIPDPARAGNIRPRLTSFVGREPELAALRSDLRGARLVTLTGPGGSGKTRLAEEAVAGLPQAWLVELAPLDRPEAVPGAVVSALGLRETVLKTNDLVTPQDDPLTLLVEYCAPRATLLVLDNCEHVIGAAAALAETLLTRCPGLTVLATSREPLGVPGELVRPVEPLAPDQAHRLFAERAAAVRPDGAGVLDDKEAVAEICRRLDGLPLAIELAAARLRMLTPRQIADRLDDRFRLLTAGSRTVLPRQQTLRAVVDWSWDLLDEQERTMLREASVFAGGWDLAAAEAVCTGPAAGLVGALVDKSLVIATPAAAEGGGGGGMRYRMLETIHEYATERAAEVPGLRAAAEERHRAWVHALVTEADPQLRSAGQLTWIARLEAELDNIRAALDRALAAGNERASAELALGMGWFWWLRAYRWEAMEWVHRVLCLGVALDTGTPPAPVRPFSSGLTPATAPGTVDLVDALLNAPDGERGHPLHALRMDLRMLHGFLSTETEAAEVVRDERVLRYMARVRAAFADGGPHAARMPGLLWPLSSYLTNTPDDMRRILDGAIANCRAYGGDWEVGVLLMFRTHMVVDSPGNLNGVDEDLAELRRLSHRVGDRWMRAQVCSAAGEAAMARSRPAEARAEYEEALRLAHEVGAHAETPFLLARLAEISYRSGDRTGALATLDEASEAAERHRVVDSRAFVLLLRAQLALDDGDVAGARTHCDAARAESGRGTPPPQFEAVLRGIDALVTAAERGPRYGLPLLGEALDIATEQHCSEVVTAALVDMAAEVLSRLGEHARALRLLAAADSRRDGRPRPQPERTCAERAEAAARAVLGAERCAAELARGAALTVDGVLAEVAEAVRRHSPAARA
ncbi:BTAD domain-containing putative transcriptional regulator [Streptomyces sp. NPDC058319]|uniref:AfsR/SARP family transcriptional regulator n=1 Tax=unclassified Streptomyces TaxID=2593676 RepID=UPI0036F133A0